MWYRFRNNNLHLKNNRMRNFFIITTAKAYYFLLHNLKFDNLILMWIKSSSAKSLVREMHTKINMENESGKYLLNFKRLQQFLQLF